jgi:hypothetical protein
MEAIGVNDLATQRIRNDYGLTVKQELFCQELAKGATQSDAYRRAYDVGEAKPETIWNDASKLASKPEVSARVAMLLQEQEAAMLRDRVKLQRHVLLGLLAESQNMDSPASARINALVNLGRTNVVGLYKDDSPDAAKGRKAEDIEAELRSKMAELVGVSPAQKQRSSAPKGRGE